MLTQYWKTILKWKSMHSWGFEPGSIELKRKLLTVKLFWVKFEHGACYGIIQGKVKWHIFRQATISRSEPVELRFGSMYSFWVVDEFL